MRRTASAPAARASTTWSGSRVKSFRSIGMPVARFAAARSSSDPPKYIRSVSTLSADAPARS